MDMEQFEKLTPEQRKSLPYSEWPTEMLEKAAGVYLHMDAIGLEFLPEQVTDFHWISEELLNREMVQTVPDFVVSAAKRMLTDQLNREIEQLIRTWDDLTVRPIRELVHALSHIPNTFAEYGVPVPPRLTDWLEQVRAEIRSRG